MQRLVALLLVVGTGAVVGALAPRSGPTLRGAALALGIALFAASLAGDLLERVKLPRITGYLFFGILVGPYAANIITRSMARELGMVNGLAIALIALVAGLEINVRRLRPQLAAILRFGGTLLGVMYAALFAVLWVAWPWLPIAPDADLASRSAMALLLATVVVSFSPAVTIAVIADSRARGPLSELVLALVILAELALILAFTVCLQLARAVLGSGGPGDVGLVVRLVWEVAGSLALGGALGSAFALYLHHVRRELSLALVALCALMAQLGTALHVEPLLVALAAGFVVENVAPVEGDALKDAVERASAPVLVVFFAAAGASLHLDALAATGVLAVLVAAVRMGAIWLGARVAGRVSGLASASGHLAWLGVVSQAGVVLGLTVIVARQFPGWGARLQTLVVAVVALNQLAGPVAFKAALARAGEIGRLSERPVAAPDLNARPVAVVAGPPPT